MVNQDPMSFNRIIDFVQDYYKEMVFAGVCLVGCGIGLYFFMNYQAHKQEQAQLAFAQTLAEVKHGEKNADLWPNADLAAKTGYRSYKNSSLAPYFLALESQIAARQGNLKEALESLETAIAAMGKNSPFYYIFKIKASIMKLDSDDLSLQTNGFKELEALAQDQANKQRDEALYYLGMYYVNHTDIIRAKETWEKLIQEFPGTHDSAMSPWAMLALDKIKQLK
jgi:tetratricopeptide (TPR) repeat protein